VDEGVQVPDVDTGEGPPHREALALEALGSGGDGPDRTVQRLDGGSRDPRKGEGVSGDGGHWFVLSMKLARASI
jgi:hypothetical protein